jgi:hypothetical protein
MEKVIKKKSGKLNEPIKDVEYLHIIHNRKIVKKFGPEVNGKRKLELSELIGNDIGEGTYRYSVKFYNDSSAKIGTIKGFSKEGKQKIEPERDNKVFEALETLHKKIDNKNNDYDIAQLLSIKDQAYNIQLDFYKMRVQSLESEIERLNKQLKESDNDSGGSDLLGMLLPIIENVLNKKA